MFRLSWAWVACAQAVSDETSLMQGLKPQDGHRTDKSKAITNLLSTASTMLKNGATPDVVDFATATLSEITAKVLPAITNGHDADQLLVDNTFKMFEAALQALQDGNDLVRIAHDEERRLSALHKECRAQEEMKCQEKRDCDYDLYATWRKFVTEETVMRQHESEISKHFCVEDPNGTSWIFRDAAVLKFPPFLEQKPVVEHWEAEYDEKVPHCETNYTKLDEKTADCDAYQEALELAACAHAHEVQKNRELFADNWFFSVTTYQKIVDEVHCLELDRWKEWTTLATVQCLLDRTNERNGRPCDESTDEVANEIAHCEDIQRSESVDHLKIVYHVIPEFPEFCLAPPWDPAHLVPGFPGRCIPDTPHAPCSLEFIAQEYSDLWIPPQPEFHSENSHCNQRPDCSVCEQQPENKIVGILFYEELEWFVYPEVDGECHNTTRQLLDGGGNPIVWSRPDRQFLGGQDTE